MEFFEFYDNVCQGIDVILTIAIVIVVTLAIVALCYIVYEVVLGVKPIEEAQPQVAEIRPDWMNPCKEVFQKKLPYQSERRLLR